MICDLHPFQLASSRSKLRPKPIATTLHPAMPRAKKTADQKHDHIVKLSLTPALYDRLVQRASAAKVPLASYCRTLLDGSEPPTIIPEINYQVYRALVSLLGDLKQLLKLLRESEQKGMTVAPKLLKDLAAAIAAVKMLMLEALLRHALQRPESP